MLDHEDLKWIAATSTELNTMLQQISRYADLARQHKGEYNYIEMLGERVELASKTAQSLFDRITSRILEGSAPKTTAAPDPSRPPEFSIVPPPSEAAPAQPKAKRDKSSARSKAPAAEPKPAAKPSAIPADIKVLNEKGNRELILLVDDETEIAELASAMLTDEGYQGHPCARRVRSSQDLRANQQTNRLGYPRFFSPRHGWRRGLRRAPRTEPRCCRSPEQRFCRAEQAGQYARARAARVHSQAVHARKTPRTSPLHPRFGAGFEPLGPRLDRAHGISPPGTTAGESLASGIDLALSGSRSHGPDRLILQAHGRAEGL